MPLNFFPNTKSTKKRRDTKEKTNNGVLVQNLFKKTRNSCAELTQGWNLAQPDHPFSEVFARDVVDLRRAFQFPSK